MDKFWRISAISLAAACILLVIALILQSRTEKVRLLTITKTQFVKKDVVIYRTFDPGTGHITTETITDKTETKDTQRETDKETEKTVSKTFYLMAGYNITAGTFDAGAGAIVLNTFTIGINHPIALRFEPRLTIGMIF